MKHPRKGKDWDDPSAAVIPVMRPQLPTADRLLPYLRRIDASRVYSNYGPLASELEERLAAHFRQSAGHVISAGSGLAALIGAILSAAGRATDSKPYALVPAYTFVATAMAVEQCGYRPCFADIDPKTWLLDPAGLLNHPELERIGLVIPVATLGRAVETGAWEEFRSRTGIPVVIDGAASFEPLSIQPERYTGSIPVALSFHATKSFGTGEGGCVVSNDVDLMARIASTLNYGLHTGRDCRAASTNGKMSEYHAAVGLAELDGWNEKQQLVRLVALRYRQQFAKRGLDGGLHTAPGVGASYVLFLARDSQEALRICASLASKAIDFRFWYGQGLHRQSYYAHSPPQQLGITDDLAPRLIGLPFAPDLSESDISKVADAIANGMLEAQTP